MGRAIDMEKDIYDLKLRVDKLENTVRGMVSKLDEVDEKAVTTKHIDLVEDVGADTEDLGSVITGDYKNDKKEEKTDNKGDAKSNKRSDNRSNKSKKSSK